MTSAAFAIPGDINTLTGGYRYEKRLLHELRAAGRDVAHVALPAAFPDPAPADTAATRAALAPLGPDRPLILDGLVYGSLDPRTLAAIAAPLVAMIHHPLAHETGLDPERRRHLFETERANLARAAHVLVPSPHTASTLNDEYGVPPNRITVALPGTDRPNRPQAPETPPLILSVGLHHPRKGHGTLLEALARLVDLDWRAVIVGRVHDPAAFATHQALCTELSLDGRVRICGQVDADALDDLYARASIFALASEYEGYGMVFAEALVRGLPIVACRAGAIPETVPAEAGRLVPPRDADAFAAALRPLLSDPELRAATAAASRRHGDALPAWTDTARIAGQVLDSVAAGSWRA